MLAVWRAILADLLVPEHRGPGALRPGVPRVEDGGRVGRPLVQGRLPRRATQVPSCPGPRPRAGVRGSVSSHVATRRVSNSPCVACRLPEKLCERMLHRYRPFLVHVSLRGCTQLRESGAAFQALAECKNLQDLNLSDCSQLSVTHVHVPTTACLELEQVEHCTRT